MNKIQLDQLLKPLIRIYDDIELEIIEDMLIKLDTYSGVKGSLAWYTDKLAELGVFNKNNSAILNKNKKEIKEIITEMINKSGKQIDNMNLLDEYYESGKLEKNPSDIFKTPQYNRIINNAIKDTNSIMNLIDSKVLEGSDELYKLILNKAYIETASGVYTYNEAIRKAINEYAVDGIRTVHYANGKTLSIEAVVRRDVTTRINKLVGDIDLQNAKELGTNLVYVSQHLGARTRTPYMEHDYEAHAEWQGKVYMIDGSSKEYDNFYETTGYGEMLGLKGINCYHEFRPFFSWEDIPKRIDEEENAKEYELLQKQREFERRIRQNKRQIQAFKQIDQEEYKRSVNCLKMTNKQYNKFIDKNDLNRDYSREYTI